MSKLQVLSEFWEFLKYNKKFWLAPILIVLLLVGFLLVIAKGSAVAPFIYTLF
jgi:competence protein ComGC